MLTYEELKGKVVTILDPNRRSPRNQYGENRTSKIITLLAGRVMSASELADELGSSPHEAVRLLTPWEVSRIVARISVGKMHYYALVGDLKQWGGLK